MTILWNDTGSFRVKSTSGPQVTLSDFDETTRERVKWHFRPNFNGPYLKNDMEYEFSFLHVLIFPIAHHSDEVSSKSERVTWGPLVDLTRNDPGAMQEPMDQMTGVICLMMRRISFSEIQKYHASQVWASSAAV